MFERCGRLSEKAEGLYVEINEAADRLGLSKEVVEEIASRAEALYQIGSLKMVNVSETDRYIRQFHSTIHKEESEIEEPKGIRGSQIVREIIAKR